MNAQHDIKAAVSQVLEMEWADFAAQHPRLAAVIDQPTLAEHLARCIADDPEYQQAMRQAAGAELSAQVAGELLRSLVRRALRMLG